MPRIAIFVDAGYLLTQGSALLSGQKQLRSQIVLDVEKTLDHLRLLASVCAPHETILRTYWYDGLLRTGRMSSEQEQVSNAQFTKLRLGVVNSQGDQKGVDSLIVTDLIDLARNRAITGAILVSGDEDIRIGVQIAQTFGVQVHLLGIKPARGSQSPDLLREADTHHEWDEAVLHEIMQIKESAKTVDAPPAAMSPEAKLVSKDQDTFSSQVKCAIDETFDALAQVDLDSALKGFKANTASVPPELDRPTLGRLRSLLGRDLTDEERKDYRKLFKGELNKL